MFDHVTADDVSTRAEALVAQGGEIVHGEHGTFMMFPSDPDDGWEPSREEQEWASRIWRQERDAALTDGAAAAVDQVPLAAPGVSLFARRSPLGAGLDGLEVALDALEALPAGGAVGDTSRLARLVERARGVLLREVAEVDATGSHTVEGGPRRTTASWLRDELHLTDAAARGQVSLALDLRDRLPVVAQAVSRGEVTIEHARAVATGVRGLDPQVVTDCQDALVQVARRNDPTVTHRMLRERAIAVDDRLAADAERRSRERAQFTISPVGDRYVSKGSHTGENGATIAAALALEVERMRAAGDERPLAARREEVLLGWARDALNSHADADSQAQDVHTVRTHLLVSVTAAQLQQAADTPTADQPDATPAGPSFGELLDRTLTGDQDVAPTLIDSGSALSRGALRGLCCDALVSLVVLPDGATRNSSVPMPDPLHVGRATRTISGPMFTALIHRDRHCVVRGCRTPPAACIGHHVHHWLDGGPTDIDNLVLLCHAHHHEHHDNHRDLLHRDGRWLTQTGWRDPP